MLLTNGCSFVWGDELLGYQRNRHRKHTFSYKLSRMLELPYENLAYCGSCNSKIFRDTINYLRKSNNKITHMVIIWSAWARDEMAEALISEEKKRKISRSSCMTQISPSRLSTLEPELSKMLSVYYAYNNPIHTGILNGLTYMAHMEWLCEIMGIKLIQGVFHSSNWNSIRKQMDPRTVEWKPWQDYVRIIMEEMKDSSRLGLNRWEDMYSMAVRLDDMRPHGHPGEQTHTEYAELLYSIFEDDQYWE